MRQGWDPRYKIWVEHGEPAPPTPPPVIDNTRQPLMSDMTALLNDLSYIPPNNEHNEPTQGDIGETSNEPTQATRNEFEELYASANEELYPGCDYVTRLDFMAKFTYFKAKGRLTDSIFNEMLEFFQNVFPISKGFKLPPSYYAIKKTFKTIGLGYESIHACEHDCCLFRGDNNKDLDFCPVCNTSRWKDSNTPGKKVPKKVLRYFPIIPRLQRLYKSSHTAKDMIWHATGKCTEPGKMQHPVDGGAWKKFDTKYPDFAKEPRNVRLGLAADGFNPFGNLSQAYSMWPVILTTYNLPPWLCMKESSFMLTLLIHGPKSPGKDIDVYLRPLIEDLKTPPRQDKTCKCWAFKVANGPSWTPISVNSCVVDGVRNLEFKYFDTNITGLKSHDCHIMMQRLLPYGLQNYLPDKIAKPIIELCSLFKKICSTTLMEDDMLKAQIKRLREGGPIRPRWMFPFERYMKKLKGYVRNKAMPEGRLFVFDAKEFKESEIVCTSTTSPGRHVPVPIQEDDPDIIHFDNSSDLPLSTSLNDLDNATLHIDGQSMEVDAPPDIINVVNEDDNIIDDEDAIPHDLADSDDEDLINVNDDGVDKVYSSEEED
ncbi:pyruvate kinase [Tanacetum coccineum]|uniref:Pyruvate kinase n=1 Tax=Tanacetum coccineum TaxID=301880 RepID=A0ABQ5E7W3_9ASTR